MDSLISWCADCGDNAVLDAVPDTMPAEYACRACSAAAVVDATAIADGALNVTSRQLVAVA